MGIFLPLGSAGRLKASRMWRFGVLAGTVRRGRHPLFLCANPRLLVITRYFSIPRIGGSGFIISLARILPVGLPGGDGAMMTDGRGQRLSIFRRACTGRSALNLVSGSSVESYHSWACWIERSTDNGNTWKRVGPIRVPGQELSETYGIIQPSLVSLGGGKLRFYARSTSQIGKICVADSSDRGLTWTQARPIDLPNPNSGIDAVALQDGRIVLVYNHTTSGRTPLNLAISTDGEHFRMFRTLEDQPGEYSYPSMIQGRNGDLYITYTWNRKRIHFLQFP
jgi:hypothetical protein